MGKIMAKHQWKQMQWMIDHFVAICCMSVWEKSHRRKLQGSSCLLNLDNGVLTFIFAVYIYSKRGKPLVHQ